MQPYLARFENDWATAAIVKQYIRNRRKYIRKPSKETGKSSNKVGHIDDFDEEGGDREGDDGKGGDDDGEDDDDGEANS